MSDSPYLNDNWTHDVKHLGYEPLCEELVELTRKTQPPFAVAVYGGWGSGKTSLMRGVMCRLGGDLVQLAPQDSMIPDPTELDEEQSTAWKLFSENFAKSKEIHEDLSENLKTVWFNPWQHQTEAHPMVALLHEIRRQFSVRLKTQENSKKIGFVALKTGLRLLDDFTATVSKSLFQHKLSLGVDKIEKTGVAYETERFQQTLDGQRFQMHFEAAIAHLLGKDTPNNDGRLVIFIDDLDRCESAAAFKLLESIKLYLSTRRCVFVLGLDSQHTERALIKAGLDDSHHARAYLHKLFQTSVYLPRPKNLSDFIDKQLGALKAADVFGWEKEKPEDRNALVALLCEILEANPRRVKNFLNQLLLRARVLKQSVAQIDSKILALLLALRNYYPEIYAMLEERNDSLLDVINGLQARGPDELGGERPFTVARLSYLPQFDKSESKDVHGLNDEDAPSLSNKGHYADSRALFEVLGRFKKKFVATFNEAPEGWQEYLRP